MFVLFLCKRLGMAASRRKKLIVYGGFTLVLVLAFLQLTYFSEAYSPLQVLSDARSEARRLLKFITLYHYQCNSTLQGYNMSHWPVCIEKVAGMNLVLGGARVMYSVGPTDLALEKLLALNYTYSVYIFHHQPITIDFSKSVKNRTKVIKTTIVPNDPADFGRNSYETQTLNNVFENLHNPVVDILKIELLSEMSHSHELLQYIVKDHLLTSVRQLHLALHIDKVDDDYLYSWYKALYELFHKQGFRLYHTTASDTLCLQVTLMESCTYYLSWIRDPGPETFILYPPAIDGSYNFEEDRLLAYMEDTSATCHNHLEVTIPSTSSINLCLDTPEKNPQQPCHLLILSNTDISGSITVIPGSRCTVTTLEIDVSVIQGETTFIAKQRRYERSVKRPKTLDEELQKLVQLSDINLMYINLSKHMWKVLTHLLDSGTFFNVEQLMLNIHGEWNAKNTLDLRMKYSELQRVEAYGLHKFETNDNKLTFHGKSLHENDNFKLNYIKVANGRS
ncbi:hypothetical protein ACF0H5_002884 [Mactra antiquata]